MKKILAVVFCTSALVIIGLSNANAQVTDDFSDGNDTLNPTWTHLSGYVNSSGQTWDASTQQYHLTAPNNGLSNLGFVGSYAGPNATDIVVSSDIVSFVDLGNAPSGPVQGGVFGIAARLNGNNAVGGLAGYAYLYEPFGNSGAGELGDGEMVLARINPGVSVQDLGDGTGVEGVGWIRKVHLDPNKDYTFTLSVIGTLLKGEVREVGGPIVAFQDKVDTTYVSGFSGYVAYSQGPTTGNPVGFPATDVTWDNFSSIPEPATALLLAWGVSLIWLGRRNR